MNYAKAKWGMGARLRFADTQDRIDTRSKQEVGETPSWGALDFYGNRQLSDSIHLRLGVDNVFDKTYAEHASRSNLFDPVAIKVNEPGRGFWLRVEGIF